MTMLKPGDTIGILGGGQLARMMALAAAPLGLDCHVYAPEAESPAFPVAAAHTRAGYDDHRALAAFAAAVSVVTYEFENVPADTADVLASRVPVLPGPRALATTQDRLVEKTFVNGIGLATPAFRPVGNLAALHAAVAELGRPSVLKTRRFGYDGKGQVIVRPGMDLAEAWAAVGGKDSVLEAFVPFALEVSVVAARAADGTVSAFDVCENEHRHHILATTRVPARIDPATEHACKEHAARIAAALDYVGVLAVEFFILRDAEGERVLVNEIAPRVHNSGHWTIEGAETSQFEQHMRAVAGWPLGSVRRRGRVEMDNLVGDEVEAWRSIVATPGSHLHLYGKREARPGRKMGHVTRILPE